MSLVVRINECILFRNFLDNSVLYVFGIRQTFLCPEQLQWLQKTVYKHLCWRARAARAASRIKVWKETIFRGGAVSGLLLNDLAVSVSVASRTQLVYICLEAEIKYKGWHNDAKNYVTGGLRTDGSFIYLPRYKRTVLSVWRSLFCIMAVSWMCNAFVA